VQQVSLGKFSLSLQQNSCGCAEVFITAYFSEVIDLTKPVSYLFTAIIIWR